MTISDTEPFYVKYIKDEGNESQSFELDFCVERNLDAEIIEYADKWGVRAHVVNPHGPGGGNPLIKVIGSQNALRLLLDDHFEDELNADGESV